MSQHPHLSVSAFGSSSTSACFTRRSSSRLAGLISPGSLTHRSLTRFVTLFISASIRPTFVMEGAAGHFKQSSCCFSQLVNVCWRKCKFKSTSCCCRSQQRWLLNCNKSRSNPQCFQTSGQKFERHSLKVTDAVSCPNIMR